MDEDLEITPIPENPTNEELVQSVQELQEVVIKLNQRLVEIEELI